METSAKPTNVDHFPASAWRGQGQAEPWPDALLERFCLRMSSQGMCVSRALMACDRRYALEQISHGHNMADDTLRAMAVELFRHFLSQRSGIVGIH
ncbi:MAG: hypothetical protein AB7S86_12850 [Hydrogenophaga sp.]|uniref:hypothetical protein n=1 Tax=Hydrogenophaga sp. TaxID=1904254 RepID=UPI003D12F4E5